MFKVLRLWPPHMGEQFTCNNSDCQSPKDELMFNSGYNRLHCFACDYNICMTCANAIVAKKLNGKYF